MSDNFAKPETLDPEAGFSQSPSVSQAANDLRAAAGERAKEVAHETGGGCCGDFTRAVQSSWLERL